MRVALVCCVLAACNEPTYVAKPLPPLVVPKQPTELTPVTVGALGFTPGEKFVYMIRLRGFTLGSANLDVEESRIVSHFKTTMLAAAVSNVSHDLTTNHDGHRATLGNEQLVMDGKARQFTTDYTKNAAHSIHTAIGAVRAWAKLGATPGFLHVVVGNEMMRVELAEPSGGKGWLRVDGKMVGESPATFTCWLDGHNVITRIEIRADGEQVTADLVR